MFRVIPAAAPGGTHRRRDPSRLVSCGRFNLFGVPAGLTLGPDPKEVGAPLDFLSVHLDPREEEIDKELDLVRTLGAAGKPIVIQEMGALHGSLRGSSFP
jgi:hypothetical protein